MQDSTQQAIADAGGQAGHGDERSRLLGLPATTVAPSVRARNALNSARIYTIGDLVQRTRLDLARIRGVGFRTINEIERGLERYGMRLGSPAIGGRAVAAASTATLREMFAVVAMEGILGGRFAHQPEAVARRAVQCADALLAELAVKTGTSLSASSDHPD